MNIVDSKSPTLDNSCFISIKDVNKYYLPMLSLKKIRKIMKRYVHTIRCGNLFLVDRVQLEEFLKDPKLDIID